MKVKKTRSHIIYAIGCTPNKTSPQTYRFKQHVYPSNTLTLPKMGKRRGKEGKGSGRGSWAKGSKLDFLEARKEEFLEAQEVGGQEVGRFYHKVARLFVRKWGWNLPLDEDGDIVEEVAEITAANPLNFSDDCDDGEAARRRDFYDTLRTVSPSLNKEAVAEDLP
jgi:hypothetical protein